MNNVTNISGLKAVQKYNKQNGGQFLGSILSWQIEPNTLVQDTVLTDKILTYQIPKYLEPKPIKRLAAFRKAISKADRTIKKDGLMLRTIKKEEGQHEGLLVGLVKETKVVDERKLAYDNLGTIHYQNDFISSTLNPSDPILAEVKTWYNFYKSYTNEDISKMLVLFANREGIRIQPRGGAYFIPLASIDLLNRLKEFISIIHPNNKLNAFEIFGTSESQKDLVNMAENNIEKEIKDLLSESQNFLQVADPSRSTYQKGIKVRKSEVKLLKQKLSSMCAVLNLQTGSINQALTQLDNTLNLEDAGTNNPVVPMFASESDTELVTQAGF